MYYIRYTHTGSNSGSAQCALSLYTYIRTYIRYRVTLWVVLWGALFVEVLNYVPVWDMHEGYLNNPLGSSNFFWLTVLLSWCAVYSYHMFLRQWCQALTIEVCVL